MLTAETFGRAAEFAKRGTSRSFSTTLDRTKLNCSRINTDGSPSQRWGHSSNILNGTMYVIGGYTGTENTSNSTWRYLNDINKFSCDTCKWQTPKMATSTMIPPPSVRSNHVACTVGNRYVVLIGGSGKRARPINSKVWRLAYWTQILRALDGCFVKSKVLTVLLKR